MRGHDRAREHPYDDRRLDCHSGLQACHRFRVDSPDGRIGIVERIHQDPRSGRPLALEIRVGLFHHQVRLAPVEWIADIRSAERRIVLGAFPLDGRGHLGTGDASDDWLRALDAPEPIRRDAIASLHKLLLDAASLEVRRRRRATPYLQEDGAIGIALASAKDALATVLSRLEDYAGQSRFITWASKFALREAAVQMRRQAWRGRTVPVDAAGAAVAREILAGPAGGEKQTSALYALGQGIDDVLTPRENAVLLATSVRDVPIDVLAERLRFPRDDVYRILQAARWKLAGALASGRLQGGQSSELPVRPSKDGDLGPQFAHDGRADVDVCAERPSGLAREPTRATSPLDERPPARPGGSSTICEP